jgi:hypothetical protein
MCSKEVSKNDELESAEVQHKEAYLESQRLMQERKEGNVKYDRIFTKKEEPKRTFNKLISGELLSIVGNSFYWKRCPGEPLILYAQNTISRRLKGKGLVELCRIRIPDTWIGAGGFRIDWPEIDGKKESDPTPILISLYLHSTDPGTFDRFVAGEEASAYLASLFFDGENAALLADLAEERFDGIV